MNAQVLALDVSGVPRKWVTFEDAIVYHAKNLVAWSAGEILTTFHGGVRRIDGKRSEISTPSIIAVKGKGYNPAKFAKVALTNSTLFARDRHLCAYCGQRHDYRGLSRDHIMPTSRGGVNTWMNVVTACIRCNTFKNNKTLKEAKMELLYLPYVPSHEEHLVLQNRRILADQMEFLAPRIPSHSRILDKRFD